jgi:hypothetical protein
LGLSFFVYGIELRSMCLWHIGGALCAPLPLFCPSEAQGKLRLGRTHGAHLPARRPLRNWPFGRAAGKAATTKTT